jgi:hypothetical protein
VYNKAMQSLQEDIHVLLQNKRDARLEKEIICRCIEEQCESFKALVLKINELHTHDVTQLMDDDQKQLWSMCLGYVNGAVMEDLETIRRTKVNRETICN